MTSSSTRLTKFLQLNVSNKRRMVKLKYNTNRRYSMMNWKNSLYESGVCNSDHPKTLLNKMFFEIMLYFCRRGRQNLRQFRKQPTSKSTLMQQEPNMCQKAAKSKLKITEKRFMYATEGVWCPVASFEKYLQYLNPKKRVLISTTQERGELRSHSLVRQHGS